LHFVASTEHRILGAKRRELGAGGVSRDASARRTAGNAVLGAAGEQDNTLGWASATTGKGDERNISAA
jgi:hypothetical protein